jgi:hypothetical protein
MTSEDRRGRDGNPAARDNVDLYKTAFLSQSTYIYLLEVDKKHGNPGTALVPPKYLVSVSHPTLVLFLPHMSYLGW